MVLKTIGRKTGKVRYSPVNYAIYKGDVYCMAGWGIKTDWYLNISETRELEVILPSGPLYGRAEDVIILEERRVVLRKILKNAGFAGFFEGFNPFTISDEVLLQKTEKMPLLRIHPVGIGNGASDPGGLTWIWTLLSILFFINLLILLVK
jgi:hypothetical protein